MQTLQMQTMMQRQTRASRSRSSSCSPVPSSHSSFSHRLAPFPPLPADPARRQDDLGDCVRADDSPGAKRRIEEVRLFKARLAVLRAREDIDVFALPLPLPLPPAPALAQLPNTGGQELA